MLLAIDIGNSNTVVGVFDDGNLVDFFRVASNHRITVDECGFFITGILEKINIDRKKVDRIVVSSVVPRLTLIYQKMCEKYLSLTPLIVSSEIELPIKIAYDDPAAVGADRIANAVAARNMYKSPVIVVDFGTATTFDVIDSSGVYLGGVIAPGPETSAADLARRAARLFEVTIEKPESVIGRSTSNSIKSGLFFGTVGQVDKIIELIIDELGEQPEIIATGGLAAEFIRYSKYIKSNYPTLTLEGLRLIAEKNLVLKS